MNSLTLALVSRIQELGERYAKTLEDLDTELTNLEKKKSLLIWRKWGLNDDRGTGHFCRT